MLAQLDPNSDGLSLRVLAVASVFARLDERAKEAPAPSPAPALVTATRLKVQPPFPSVPSWQEFSRMEAMGSAVYSAKRMMVPRDRRTTQEASLEDVPFTFPSNDAFAKNNRRVPFSDNVWAHICALSSFPPSHGQKYRELEDVAACAELEGAFFREAVVLEAFRRILSGRVASAVADDLLGSLLQVGRRTRNYLCLYV